MGMDHKGFGALHSPFWGL